MAIDLNIVINRPIIREAFYRTNSKYWIGRF